MFTSTEDHLFIHYISIAPLQVHHYSEALPTRGVVLKKEVCGRHKNWVDARFSQGHKRT